MATSRRRRPEDDETVLSVLPPDDEDEEEDEEEDDEEEDEAPPVARYVKRRPAPEEREDDGADQIIPDRVLRIPLPAPWAHLRIYGWFDYPKEVAEQFVAADSETADEATQRVMEALRQVIVQHDGWKDRRGKTLPQPTSRKFWDEIPNPLATAIIRQFFVLVKRNPTQRASKKKTPRR